MGVQLSIGTDDVYKTANAVEMQHGRTVRPPGPLPGIPTKIYVCLDPDDWKVVSYPLLILLSSTWWMINAQVSRTHTVSHFLFHRSSGSMFLT